MKVYRGASDLTYRSLFAVNFQTAKLHTSKALFKKANSVEESQKISSVDLSSALKHTSKLRITNKELATLDEDLEIPPNYRYNKNYTRDINNNVLPPEVQRAIENERKLDQQPKNVKSSKVLKEKTNSKLLSGFSKREADIRQSSKTWIPKQPKSNLRQVLRKAPINPRFEEKDSVTESLSIDGEITQVQRIDSNNIAKLAHELDRTLFSPGIHFLQDPRTRIYNFTPYLKNIIKLEDFNFDAIEPFVAVSKDETLLKVATEQNKKFYSSTSSMTSTLIQFYLLLNNYNPESTERFSFPKLSGVIEKFASSVVVLPKGKNKNTGDTIYAVESDKSADTEILLSAMGHCLEALLTTEEKNFDKYKLKYKNDLVNHPQPQNVYNYSTYADFLMRSQLDCYDERLPGNGTFDLKTRAVCAIRHDSVNPELENNKYQIWKLNGATESFEREISDLIRTGALLKYGFQARIGQMDGIFIAYHNINSFFGFQYLPLSEIDNIFFNHVNNEKYKHFNLDTIDDLNDDLPSYVAESQFKLSLSIWDKLLKRIIKDLGKPTPFRLVLKTEKRPNSSNLRMHVSAVSLDQSQVQSLQTFPAAFKTSFRETLSEKERLKNLKAHRDELNAFNEETAKNTVLSYHIDLEQSFGKYNSKDIHAYPRSKTQSWDVKYKLTKVKEDPKKFLSSLSVASDMIVNSFERNMTTERPRLKDDKFQFGENASLMQIYSTIGEARSKGWEEKDSNPVVYRPNIS